MLYDTDTNVNEVELIYYVSQQKHLIKAISNWYHALPCSIIVLLGIAGANTTRKQSLESTHTCQLL